MSTVSEDWTHAGPVRTNMSEQDLEMGETWKDHWRGAQSSS